MQPSRSSADRQPRAAQVLRLDGEQPTDDVDNGDGFTTAEQLRLKALVHHRVQPRSQHLPPATRRRARRSGALFAIVGVGYAAVGSAALMAGTFGFVIIRCRPIAAWIGWGLVVVGAAHIGAAVALSEGGIFAPEGVLATSGPVLFEAWQALTALGILRLARQTRHEPRH